VEKEVIIGATCTLTQTGSDETHKVETDNFGDFWFNGLPDDRTYSLKIQKGSASKVIDAITTAVDVNLGDIPMPL
jgi:hypothetical protein